MKHHMPILPPDGLVEASQVAKRDHFYAPPPYVRAFISTVNATLGDVLEADTWSIARLVSVFDRGGYFLTSVPYETVEDNPKFALGHLLELYKEKKHESR